MSEKRRSQETGKVDENSTSPRYEVRPEFWENLIDSLPPWIDEIGAIVLLVFGVISFMALLNVSSDATLSMAWADALRRLFGDGGILVAFGIFASGVIILLPKVGLVFQLSVRRVLALQIVFLMILALLHLSADSEELKAVARAGQGGGIIGWGIVFLPHWLLGSTVTVIMTVMILVIATLVVLGVRHTHITDLLERYSARLQEYGDKWSRITIETPAAPQSPPPSALDLKARRRANVVRIRPDISNLPPSQRANLAQEQKINLPKTRELPPMPEEHFERLEKALTNADDAASRDDFLLDFDAIGELVPKTKKSAPQLITRPDGRIKRYFAVETMKEEKKLNRRGKNLPPLELLQDIILNPPDENEINHNVVLIENTLMEFDIHIDVVDVKVGPTVTQYAVQPFREVTGPDGEIIKERTRLSKIAALANDLALSLAAKRLRLETPVPGQSYMGVEVPNKNPSTVALRSVYESRSFYDAMRKSNSPLLIPLGRDVSGVPVVVDIGTMPHLLIAGTTGSGKSVCIAAIATALIINNEPDTVKFVMLDPKMVELSRFNGLPHLLGPVETDMERIIGVLRWCTREMERRYKLLEEAQSRNIDTYNSRLGQRRKSEHLPYIVMMVDEIGDLMMTKPEETEHSITRLAQMARAVGMHLIIATQRPSVDVITGLIKANFPARVSFAVASGIDSRVILDSVGAETLLSKGDLLYQAQDAAGPRRLQGCYVTDNEVRDVVAYWQNWHKEQIEAGKMERLKSAPWERGLTRREILAETDPMLEDAIELVVEEQEASASQIQRKLGLGYPRAARIIDLLEELGVIGKQVAGGRARRVLIEKGKDPFKEIIDQRNNGKH